MHDLGDPYLSRFDNTVDGTLTAATTAVLTVTLPDGTTAAPAVSQPSTGRYQATYVSTQVGHHRLRWASTGPGARAHSDVLNVHDAFTSLISFAEARDYLNFDEGDTVDDEELREYVPAASEVVERHTGEAVARRAVVEDHLLVGSTALVLRKAPVVSVSSVASPDGTVVWLVAGFAVDTFAGVLTGQYLSGLVRVTYVAGQPVVPPNYLLATAIIAGHLWQQQRWSSLGRQPGFDGEEALTPPGLGHAIPARAVELLGARGPNPP